MKLIMFLYTIFVLLGIAVINWVLFTFYRWLRMTWLLPCDTALRKWLILLLSCILSWWILLIFFWSIFELTWGSLQVCASRDIVHMLSRMSYEGLDDQRMHLVLRMKEIAHGIVDKQPRVAIARPELLADQVRD